MLQAGAGYKPCNKAYNFTVYHLSSTRGIKDKGKKKNNGSRQRVLLRASAPFPALFLRGARALGASRRILATQKIAAEEVW
eukprot:6192047-Pleurochrysis_carterae.AAC.1